MGVLLCQKFWGDNLKLVIAEKPSVAMNIAKVLGAGSRKDGYMEGGEWIVSWCVGHLVELANADVYDPRYSKWAREDLPIIPQVWQHSVLPGTKQQYEVLRRLMNDPRVESLVCATDAGREGELIFRLVYHQAGCGKPFQRLWVSSMEESAVRKGFDNLLSGANYDNLYEAALCRSKADWLVGINATRLFTTLYGGQVLNIGRVVTPTLALVTEREAAIQSFQPEKFYTVELTLDGFTASSGRIKSKTDAGKLRLACDGAHAVVRTFNVKDKTDHPPKLYDLTSLQRDANRLLGYSAQQTLDVLQGLYERKLATYPRTDSQYLTDAMEAGLPGLCGIVSGSLPFLSPDEPPRVDARQVINNKKVSDHHAILPTANIRDIDWEELPSAERAILALISTRLLCGVGETHLYQETAVLLECGGQEFMAKGRTETSAGWKALDRAMRVFLTKSKQDDDLERVNLIPTLSEGQRIETSSASVKTGITKPPARYTDDTLLGAMERAGAEDFAKLEEKPERAGLGTPATRAATIEKLIKSGFVAREKKALIPTQKGIDLIAVMPTQLKSAKLTADWEERLNGVQRGTISPEAFMRDITRSVDELVKTYQGVSRASAALSDKGEEKRKTAVLGKCPRCGKNVVEGKSSYYCEGYYSTPSCGFALWKNDRFFQSQGKALGPKTVQALLKDGRVLVKGLRSRKGTNYDATVIMRDTGDKYIKWELEFPKN